MYNVRYKRTLEIAEYFSSSNTFLKWLDLKRLSGDGNENINACFPKKTTGMRKDSKSHAIAGLYDRFLRYAIDIDNGVEFVQRSLEYSQHEGHFTFLDIGFAPGGMVSLLLEKVPNSKGIGINLDPAKGGNVYPPQIISESRFKVLTSDVIELARNFKEIDFQALYPSLGISKFDLVIVGITTSGSNQKASGDQVVDELELKNLLHFSQLLLAFKFLNQNGKLLIRMHLGLRLVDLHILSLILENFDHVTATKPLTEFAMRKTFWILAEGFKGNQGVIERLAILTQPGVPAPYEAVSSDSEQLNNPILMTDSISILLEKYGTDMIRIMAPIWETQSWVLEQIMEDRMRRICFRCKKNNSKTLCSICRKTVPLKMARAYISVHEQLLELPKRF